MSFEGVVTKFVYDEFGRLKTKLFFENQVKYNAGTPGDTWTYEYDARGRTTKVTQQKTGEAARATITTYNAEGRIEC